ncbi:hypothetical protein PROFUN_03054 [Planoprotostelium fungivorum]|uniref:Uncharacterized protein n=1 Tax=Planoprotostelium fungivorum TaxID=1890364 RepID=A0A2P6NQ33_9EUKA|nr:hypothetical protein PROFUN_03054 [Planoprotostelium fungivorum]
MAANTNLTSFQRNLKTIADELSRPINKRNSYMKREARDLMAQVLNDAIESDVRDTRYIQRLHQRIDTLKEKNEDFYGKLLNGHLELNDLFES